MRTLSRQHALLCSPDYCPPSPKVWSGAQGRKGGGGRRCTAGSWAGCTPVLVQVRPFLRAPGPPSSGLRSLGPLLALPPPSAPPQTLDSLWTSRNSQPCPAPGLPTASLYSSVLVASVDMETRTVIRGETALTSPIPPRSLPRLCSADPGPTNLEPSIQEAPGVAGWPGSYIW